MGVKVAPIVIAKPIPESGDRPLSQQQCDLLSECRGSCDRPQPSATFSDRPTSATAIILQSLSWG